MSDSVIGLLGKVRYVIIGSAGWAKLPPARATSNVKLTPITLTTNIYCVDLALWMGDDSEESFQAACFPDINTMSGLIQAKLAAANIILGITI